MNVNCRFVRGSPGCGGAYSGVWWRQGMALCMQNCTASAFSWRAGLPPQQAIASLHGARSRRRDRFRLWNRRILVNGQSTYLVKLALEAKGRYRW
jgi:hypothetical protein